MSAKGACSHRTCANARSSLQAIIEHIFSTETSAYESIYARVLRCRFRWVERVNLAGQCGHCFVWGKTGMLPACRLSFSETPTASRLISWRAVFAPDIEPADFIWGGAGGTWTALPNNSCADGPDALSSSMMACRGRQRAVRGRKSGRSARAGVGARCGRCRRRWEREGRRPRHERAFGRVHARRSSSRRFSTRPPRVLPTITPQSSPAPPYRTSPCLPPALLHLVFRTNARHESPSTLGPPHLAHLPNASA